MTGNMTGHVAFRYHTATITALHAQDQHCLQLITTSKYSINGQTNYPLYNAENLCFSIYFEFFMVSRTIRVISYYSTTSLTIGVIIYYSKISQTICYSKLHLTIGVIIYYSLKTTQLWTYLFRHFHLKEVKGR